MNTIAISFRTDEKHIELLDQLAKQDDRSRNYIINHAIDSYIEQRKWEIEQINIGLQDIDQNHTIENSTVMNNAEAYLNRNNEE